MLIYWPSNTPKAEKTWRSDRNCRAICVVYDMPWPAKPVERGRAGREMLSEINRLSAPPGAWQGHGDVTADRFLSSRRSVMLHLRSRFAVAASFAVGSGSDGGNRLPIPGAT